MSTATHSTSDKSWKKMFYLTLGALGVVYGDIGTSPLYAFRECFINEAGIILNQANVFGVLSLIFWTLLLVISIKYMIFVLRADNKGEGGILSLMALAMRTLTVDSNQKQQRRFFLLLIGVFGAALLYGDGIITPAISIVSAVEGIKYVTPVFEPYVIPITIFIINALFLVQRFGTGSIGRVFGPIIVLWFTVLGYLGFQGILQNPSVLAAVSPHYAIQFMIENGFHSFIVIGSVFLVVTGGEALYADMGHFGRAPIRWGWFLVAMPGLLLNYFGQGALVLNDPETISNPFYLLAPKDFLPAMVILSTMASIIASQALISGVFSITRQAIQLGLCPRLTIIHTSSSEVGQIYIPAINWALFFGVIWFVLTFKSSSQMAGAYGIAVTGTMIITTLLALFVAKSKWGWGWWKSLLLFIPFLIIDLGFFSSNLTKLDDGGWVPLAIAIGLLVLMLTWQKGRRILYAKLKERSVSVEEFCQTLLKNPPIRISGTAVYMAGDPWGVPVPLLHNLKHNKVLHERVAILTIQTQEVPFVMKKNRVDVMEVIPNLYRVIVKYGFMEIPKMRHILEACREKDLNFKVNETTFVLGRETILPSSRPGMPLWQEKIFALMSRNAQRPTAFFKIPPNQVIEVGIQVEI
ncbi:MAG: potassium transporter Kup [Bdellovibrionales bacterium]